MFGVLGSLSIGTDHFVKAKIGDQLTIKTFPTKNDTRYAKLTQITVIGRDPASNDIICYVPWHESLDGLFELRTYHVNAYNVKEKFIGQNGIWVTKRTIITKLVAGIEGENCSHCKNFFIYAQANSDDGLTFTCRDCKFDPYR